MAEKQKETVHYPVNAVHLMRTAQGAHLRLSAMADQKASILMGATFVIFTITVSQSRESVPPLALLVLGAAAFLAAIFAILALLPKIRPTRSDEAPNLLFFGSFTHLGQEEFTDQLLSRLRTDELIYRTMAQDMYQNGLVLQRKKYRMLGLAYRVFIVGLVASFLTFIVERLI